jgi:16S rRNA (cytosine967-C5)-methyltransferase
MLALAREDSALATLFDGQGHGPAPIAAGELAAAAGIAPAWLVEALAASDIAGEEAAALLERASLDLRVNTLKAAREELTLPVPAEPTVARDGLRLPHGVQVEQWEVYREGRVEVQDTGSQMACAALEAKPGETVVDLCAGAGGKTLALAAAMVNRGTLIAADTDRGRLSRLLPRAARAGAAMIESVLLDPGKEAAALAPWAGRADAVLVDAPCSGTGTWRRNPEARWRLTPEQLARHVATQARLLDLASALVRPGGRLVYVVCSLLDAEGADQAAAFLARHSDWAADDPRLSAGVPRGTGLRLTPLHDGTDGFFIARLARLC